MSRLEMKKEIFIIIIHLLIVQQLVSQDRLLDYLKIIKFKPDLEQIVQNHRYQFIMMHFWAIMNCQNHLKKDKRQFKIEKLFMYIRLNKKKFNT